MASKAVLQNCHSRPRKKEGITSTFRKILQVETAVRIRRRAENAISAGKLKHYHLKDPLLFRNHFLLIYLKWKEAQILNKQLHV